MNKRIIRHLFLSSISFLIISQVPNVNGQPLDSLWMHYYDYDSMHVRAFDIIPKYDSGYLVVGQLDGNDHDAYLISTDKAGQLLWEQFYSTPESDGFRKIINTSDTNYLIGGRYNGSAWLVKMDESGDTIWTKSYGNNFGEIASLQELSNTDLIITGNPTGSGLDLFLMKTNQYGDTIWTRYYIFDDPFCSLSSFCVQQTSDGGYMLTSGYYSGFGIPFSMFIKTDSNGDTLWTIDTMYELDFSETYFKDILIDYDTIYVIGSGHSELPNCIYVIKMKSDGEILWTKGYGDEYCSTYYCSGTYTNAGTIMITGKLGFSSNCIYVVEIDKNGNFLWDNTYGDNNRYNYPESIKPTYDSGYAIAGTSSYDFFVLKLGEKPSQIVPINELDKTNLQIFPNPIRDNTNIEFSITSNAMIIITIYDLNGKKISVLANKLFQEGRHNLLWDASTIPNGIYFCKVEFDNQVQAKKIIVSK